MVRGAALGLVAVVASACGGNDSNTDTDGSGGGNVDDGSLDGFDCAIPVALSGAVDFTIAREALACAYSASYGSEVSTMFLPQSGPVESVSLDLEDITRGQLGVFPLTLTIRLEGGDIFVANDCTVDVTSHDPNPDKPSELGTVYRLGGSGTCAAAAVSEGASEVIEIADFEFVASIIWGD